MTPQHSIQLTTPRTTMRPVGPEDAARLHELWSSPGVRRFLWDDRVFPLEQTMEAIERSVRMFHDDRLGLWAAFSPDSSTMIGFAGLWPFRDPPEIELVYGVAEPLWKRGYAPEIARPVIEYALRVLRMSAVRASTDAGNAASIRVLEKLGFTLVRQAAVDGRDTVFYTLTRR